MALMPSSSYSGRSINDLPVNRGVARLDEKDSSSHGAAMLLMKVRNIAMSEVDKSSLPLRRPCLMKPQLHRKVTDMVVPLWKIPEDSSSDPPVGSAGGFAPSHRSRFRTVSMESMEDVARVAPSSPSSESDSDDESCTFVAKPRAAVPVSPCQPIRNVIPEHREKTCVGTDLRVPLKGVLRKKYAWREFPELEGYLVEHRDQYLSFSSQLNYTAEQKRYNNRLTQGLLDLASEHGYVFEGFTFAMIRDRIRCYYKSYVQAVKKKKRKKKYH